MFLFCFVYRRRVLTSHLRSEHHRVKIS